MKHKKYAVFLGRWQPLHFSHMKLIATQLEQGKPVLILVRDIPPDEKNPFTTEQTVRMLETVYEKQDVKIMAFPDVEGIYYGRGVGYNVEELVLPPDDQRVSATQIRDSVRIGDDQWKSFVDPKIHDLVEEYLKD